MKACLIIAMARKRLNLFERFRQARCAMKACLIIAMARKRLNIFERFRQAKYNNGEAKR